MRRKILLIDDNSENAARCRSALAGSVAAEYELTVAASGDEGLAIIETARPNCVLLTSALPGNGSIAILQRIRARHGGLPVIMLAGPEFDKQDLEEMRCDKVRCLPMGSVEARTLHEAIDNALGEKRTAAPEADAALPPAKTVLVIDDNPDDREAYRRALNKAEESYRYLEAGESIAGVEMIEKYSPDCVLLDYSLPGINGLDTLQRIHAVDAFMPVIMLTGQGSEAIAVKAMKEGAQNYLVKTALTPNLLNRAILGAIEHASLERQISEQRRQIYTQKLALAETDRLKSAILDSAATMIFATDGDGRVLTFNPAAEQALGYAAEDIVGRHTPVLWCDDAEIAARRSELADQYRVELPDGFEVLSHVPQLEGREIREWTFIRSDGRRFPACLSMTPLHDDNQQVVGFLGMADDITESKRQQLALRASEETFRSAVQNAPNGMALINPDGSLLKVNPAVCALLGFSEEELLATPLRSIPHPEDVDIDRDMTRQLFRGHIQSYRVEKRLLHKSGRIVHVLLSMSLMRDSEGVPKYYVAQVQDITERKEMERIKNEFISVVSHELRTPLTSIRGSLGLLYGNIVEGIPEVAQTLIDRAFKNCERLIVLINDILDIDKIASGTMRFDMRPANVASVLREATEAIRDYADAHGIRVRMESPADDLTVKVDHDRLIQVLNNLLSNAVKFSPPSGEVELSAEARDGRIRIWVRDHGPGIPQEFRDRLFSKFFQVDASSTREKGGTGLGLHISKQLIEHMGGEIGFDSEVDVGTSAWAELPAFAAEDIQQLPPEIADHIGRRVLVCEDDDRVAWLIQKMLTKEGFAADVVHNISEARQKLRQGGYAAMTLDLALPSGNGMEFARELSEDNMTARLPIVIVSGTERESWIRLDDEAGIVDWIVKPISRQRLIASVEKATAAFEKAAVGVAAQ